MFFGKALKLKVTKGELIISILAKTAVDLLNMGPSWPPPDPNRVKALICVKDSLAYRAKLMLC